MLSQFRARLTYANVVAMLALFAALSGGTYAAATIPATNSTPSAHAAKKKVKRGPRGKRGKRGPRGFKGTTGGRGIAGATGAGGATGARGLTGTAGSPAASFLGGRLLQVQPEGFFAPVGTSTSDATSDNVAILSPARTIVARDLSVKELTTPTWAVRTYSLAVNGTNTALSCFVTGAGTTCEDTGPAASIPAGSRLSLHFQGSGGQNGPSATVLFGWRATTP